MRPAQRANHDSDAIPSRGFPFPYILVQATTSHFNSPLLVDNSATPKSQRYHKGPYLTLCGLRLLCQSQYSIVPNLGMRFLTSRSIFTSMVQEQRGSVPRKCCASRNVHNAWPLTLQCPTSITCSRDDLPHAVRGAKTG